MGADRDGLTDKGKLLFGAGFVFGVMTAMVVLAVVLVVVESGGSPPVAGGRSLVVTAVGAAVFAAIVGAALSYLAFPENRTKIPVDPEQFGRGDAEETDAE